MNRFFSAKVLVVAALTTAALGATTAAHARPEVYFSIDFQNSPVWTEPAPVYVQPRTVYVQPRPVYVEPLPIYVQPAPVYVQPTPVYVRRSVVVVPPEVIERPRWDGYNARHQWERERAWRHAEWHRQEQREHREHDGRKWHHDFRD